MGIFHDLDIVVYGYDYLIVYFDIKDPENPKLYAQNTYNDTVVEPY